MVEYTHTMSKPEKIVSINTAKNPSEAFDRIMRGVDLLADAVKQTLGPSGRNFLIEKSGGRITNDGISIAREIQARDEVEDLGLRMVREAAIKTNEEAGDGTTTATTLAQAILKECKKYMSSGTKMGTRSVMSLKRQIEKETTEAIEALKAMATPITTEAQLIEVARVSVEDEELATMVGKAQWQLGKDGMIIAEETADPTCTIEHIKGIRIDNGLGTSVVMNDVERQRLLVDDCSVLLTNHVIQSLDPITPALQALIDRGERKIVLVAKAYSADAIRTIMENHKQGVMIYPVQAPYVNQREIMKDLEAALGGIYVDDEDGTLDSITVAHFGRASKVFGYRYSAVFAGTEDRNLAIAARVERLRKELEGEPSVFMRKAIEARIAQMENGFALLKIGSTSDIDRKYKFDKAEDAVNAVRSAFQEGTVPGAGQAMKAVSEGMASDALLRKPLMAPYEQIMANAGEVFEVEPWVRNSLKVERVALLNAAKIAGTIVTAGGVIATEKIKPLDTLLRPSHDTSTTLEG